MTIHLSGLPGPRRAACMRSCLALHRVGFTQPPRRRDAGALLPHHFTLACSISGELHRRYVSVALSLGFPRVGSPTTLPCDVRTFLWDVRRPSGHLACACKFSGYPPFDETSGHWPRDPPGHARPTTGRRARPRSAARSQTAGRRTLHTLLITPTTRPITLASSVRIGSIALFSG